MSLFPEVLKETQYKFVTVLNDNFQKKNTREPVQQISMKDLLGSKNLNYDWFVVLTTVLLTDCEFVSVQSCVFYGTPFMINY